MRDVLPLLIVVLGALSTARLTRLVTADQLTEPLRRRVIQRVQEGGHLEYLVSCAWCASVWIGFPVALALTPWLAGALHVHGLLAALALVYGQALAYSQVTGLLASREVEV